MSSNNGSQSQPIGQRSLSDILTSFVTLTTPTATNLSQPNVVTTFSVSVSVTPGTNPGTTVLNQLPLNQAIALLPDFTFQVKATGSTTSSYVITGSIPQNPASGPNGGKMTNNAGAIGLADIIALISQVTFSIQNQAGGAPVSWTLNGALQNGVPPQSSDLVNGVGQFTALYVFLLLHLFQFGVQPGNNPVIQYTIDGNKTTRE